MIELDFKDFFKKTAIAISVPIIALQIKQGAYLAPVIVVPFFFIIAPLCAKFCKYLHPHPILIAKEHNLKINKYLIIFSILFTIYLCFFCEI